MNNYLYNETDKIEIEIYSLLKTVIDPELGINIIDLGLVYKIGYSNNAGICIDMTLSTPACPMGDIIIDNIETVIKTKFSDKKITINMVWEPKWNSSFITPAGKEMLNTN